jgi:hypothetical protein
MREAIISEEDHKINRQSILEQDHHMPLTPQGDHFIV